MEYIFSKNLIQILFFVFCSGIIGSAVLRLRFSSGPEHREMTSYADHALRTLIHLAGHEDRLVTIRDKQIGNPTRVIAISVPYSPCKATMTIRLMRYNADTYSSCTPSFRAGIQTRNPSTPRRRGCWNLKCADNLLRLQLSMQAPYH